MRKNKFFSYRTRYQMNIVIVTELYDSLTNGTAMTAFRFVNALRKKGHSVKVIAIDAKGEDCYPIPEKYIPIATEVARKQQVKFGQPNMETYVNAFQGADLIHLLMPFKLERTARKVAKQMGIPCSGAFHLQPENISYNCCMGWSRLLPNMIYSLFKVSLYRHLDHVHCPSLFIAEQLRKHHYKAKLHVISNGVDPAFQPPAVYREAADDRFNILMIGRLAHEKRQDVLIKAIALSKYADKIHLTLAGKGPCRKKVEKLAAKKLVNPVTFGFYKQEELIEVIHQNDLYVHAAEVEIEAISCIEAFACGLVPVICNSKKSATPQFALDERSLYKLNNPKDLAAKIDYWIEHPQERAEMSRAYVEQGKRYGIDYSIEKTEEMFRETIATYKEKQLKSKKDLRKERKKFATRNVLKRIGSFIAYYFFLPILWIGTKCAWGTKVRGRKNLRGIKHGAVSISNHVHMMDGPFNAVTLSPRKVIFTVLESNLRIPYAGFWLKCMGASPVPDSIRELNAFTREMRGQLKRGRTVHFYPEAHLINYYAGLRPFKRGPFSIACDAQVPVIPIVMSWRKRRGFYKLFCHKQPCVTITICPPQRPNFLLMRREMEIDLMKRCETVMREEYEKSNDGQNVDYLAEHQIPPEEYHVPSMSKQEIRRPRRESRTKKEAQQRHDESNQA